MAVGASATALTLMLLTLASVPASSQASVYKGKAGTYQRFQEVEARLNGLKSIEGLNMGDVRGELQDDHGGVTSGLCLNDCDGDCAALSTQDVQEHDSSEGGLPAEAHQVSQVPDSSVVKAQDALRAAERAVLLDNELVMPDGQLLRDYWEGSNLPTCSLMGVVCDDEDFVAEIVLADKDLRGTLPDSWSALTHPSILELDANKITGTLPPTWSILTSLQMLNVGWNQLTGTLPDGYSTMTNMLQMYFDFNRLTGPLPTSWSTLSRLQWLYLKNNHLTGPLPASWTGMVGMKSLQLMHNSHEEERNAFSAPLPCAWMTGFPKLLALSRTNSPTSLFRWPFLDLPCAEEMA